MCSGAQPAKMPSMTRVLIISELEEDMSQVTGNWIFPKQREFDLSYIKRTYSINLKTLKKDN